MCGNEGASMNPYVLYACVRGYSHILSGKECQDSFQLVMLEDGTLLLSVADGHGSKSCPYSKKGSETAVQVFCATLSALYRLKRENRDELKRILALDHKVQLAQSIVGTWKDRIAKFHRKEQRPIPTYDDGRENLPALYRMYGSTLLGALIAPDFVFVFQLGDGDIVRVDDRGVQNLVEANKFLGVESDSLCGDDAWKKAVSVLYSRKWDQGRPYFLQLSTDGFANSFVSDGEFHKTCGEYLQMMERYGADAVQENLASWLAETSRLGCGDDTTALIAYFAGSKAAEAGSDESEEVPTPESQASEEPADPAEQAPNEQEVNYESNSDFTEVSESEQTIRDPSSADGRWGVVPDLGVSD